MIRREVKGTQGYAENAEALAAQYESVTFAEVYRDTLHLFPIQPSRVLDLGAGSGRDAAALSAMGHQVLAVEPTPELRHHGQRLHSTHTIEWIDDSLPELNQVLARKEQFNLILLTAVWMHLDPTERAIAMERLKRLIKPAGLIIMSIRQGPVPEGRRMFNIPPDETGALARGQGLQVVHQWERQDALGRPEVHWTTLVLTPSSTI
jgi:2-polyprenyl-3-methyl-5-hydroxy-6-metoxy-1,4-benzoquinol methylase